MRCFVVGTAGRISAIWMRTGKEKTVVVIKIYVFSVNLVCKEELNLILKVSDF